MGRMPITPGNEIKTFDSFPRLKLDKDEKALIHCPEDPTVVYVHTLKRPKIVNGKPAMVTKERKDKTTYETNDMDFVSRPMCLGDESILDERGLDPKNCPACAVAKKNDSVDAPQQRFAMHVFRYATKPGTWDLSSPFGGAVVVWSFTVKMYNKLIEIVKENEEPLKDKDIKLECNSKEFQTYEVSSSIKAQWQKSAAYTEHVETAVRDNQTDDLDAMCGKRMTRDAIQDDLDSIEEAWKIANGTADDIAAADRQNLNGALSGILNGASVTNNAPVQETAAPATAPSAEDADGFAELLALRNK